MPQNQQYFATKEGIKPFSSLPCGGKHSYLSEAHRALGLGWSPAQRTAKEAEASQLQDSQAGPCSQQAAQAQLQLRLPVSKVLTLPMHHLRMPPGPAGLALPTRKWTLEGWNPTPRSLPLLLPGLQAASFWVAEEKVSPE